MSQEPPKQIGPYEIVKTIGRGGMGDVYEAIDPRLDRTVAIKVLRDEHAGRLRHEAQAVAALNHPHICTIYDVGPDYLVMEFVDGRPIQGPLPVDLVVGYGRQIASALQAAHERGIVHRDLKPANILVTSAGVKLLDFGLARRLSTGAARDGSTAARTLPGAVLGTAGYMSPEQASGDPADSRSDIFALGAVLYEAVSGRRAFGGETLLETLAAVLQAEPPPIDAPPALDALIRRCLRKNPSERYQSAAEVVAALERIERGAPLLEAAHAPGSSIAVLPFANLGGERDNEYFGDGLAEEILNALTRVPRLKVTARTSSFAFRGREQDIRRIGEALDVETVLEGSVRRAGNRIRVTAQLISVANGFHLWSDRYDRELTDIFAVQDEIAAAITNALRLRLAPREARYVPDMPAYDAFLRGRHLLLELGDRLPQAMEAFQRAAALDPQYPDPHVELAAVETLRWYFGLTTSHEAASVIRTEVHRAIELGGLTPRAQGLLGVVAAAYDYEWARAGEMLAASLIEPYRSEGDARWCRATFWLAPQGRFDEALALIAESRRADPLNLAWRTSMTHLLGLAGRHDEALAAARDILAIDPRQWIARFYLAENLWATGAGADARAILEEAHAMVPWHARTTGMLAAVLAATGDRDRAASLVAGLEAAPDAPGHSTGLVIHAVMTGDIARAARWWARAVDRRELWVTFQARSWFTRELRASAEWPALAQSMRLPEAGRPDA